jgi:Fe-S-cluster containining protein
MITCEECDGKCCKDVAVEIDEPETQEDWDEIRWFLYHENIIVYKDNEGDWLIEFHTRCKHLDENNKCMIYDKRPKTCREHDVESCQVNGEGNIGEIVFRTVEDLEKYLKEQKKKWANMKID